MKRMKSAHELDGPKTSEEIKHFEARVDIADLICDYIEMKGWTQKEAANQLGITQPRVSNLLNGQVSKFSLGMLLEMLERLGFSFQFKSSFSKKRAQVSLKLEQALEVA